MTPMADHDRAAAEKGLREKLEHLEAELARIAAERAQTGQALARLRSEVRDLTAREHELAESEGALRGQIGELKRALEAFEEG